MAADIELSAEDGRRLLRERFGSLVDLQAIGGGWHVLAGSKLLGCGVTVREALESVGVDLPTVRTKFSNFGQTVRLGDQFIATARSASMARRIAAALTFYKKDR